MIRNLKEKAVSLLRWSEKYTKTDMVYFARGSLWMNASYVVTNVLAFLLSIAFARLLPKEIYGTYQFILSIGAILSALTLTGMNSAITQAVARGYEGVVKKSILVQLRWNLLSFVVALGISTYYFINQNTTIALGILLIGICIPIFNAFNTYLAVISGKKDFPAGFYFGLAIVIPYNIAMFASIVFFKDPVALVITNFVVNCVITVILYFATLRKYRLNEAVDESTIPYGKHLSAAGIINTIAAQLDNLLVFHFLGTANLAIYAFASTIPERIAGSLKGVSVMAFPKLSERAPTEIKQSIFSKSLRLAFLTVVVSIIYIAIAPLLFHTLFPQYSGSIFYSQAYAVMLIFAGLSSLPFTALTAMKAQKAIYAYNVLSPIFSISLMVILMITYGILGLIVAKAISGLFNYLLSLFFVSRHKTV